MLARLPAVRYFPRMPKARQTAKPDLLPTKDVAQLLGVHVSTVARMVAANEIQPAMKIPGKTGAYLFDRADVERLAREAS